MATVSKYKKSAYMKSLIPLMMLFCCLGLFYLFMGSLNGEGFANTSVMISSLLLFLSIIFGWLLILSLKLFSRIVIDENGLTYYLPYLPILVFTKDLHDYDCKCNVRVFNRYGELINGVWLVKNGIVKHEIYDNIFANFQELYDAIYLPKHHIKKPVPPFTHTAYQLGVRRIKNEQA